MSTVRAEKPRRCSMLVMQFHVSPMHRCATRTRRGNEKSVFPHVRQISVDDDARRTDMVNQMKGNAIPGGVHAGRFTSFRTGAFGLPSSFSKPPRGGREAGKNEKMRDRKERKRKMNGTTIVGSVTRLSIDLKSAAMIENSPIVATGYLAICAQSMPSAGEGGLAASDGCPIVVAARARLASAGLDSVVESALEGARLNAAAGSKKQQRSGPRAVVSSQILLIWTPAADLGNDSTPPVDVVALLMNNRPA